MMMDNAKGKPFVSAMIVYRNEEQTIGKALASLINQDYPKDKYEIILVDGISDDNSSDVIAGLLAEHTDVNIQLIKNEKKYWQLDGIWESEEQKGSMFFESTLIVKLKINI